MPARTPNMRTRRRLSRRGMTLLEVLLAITLIVLIATTLTSAVGSIVSMERQSRRAVAGYELANRLMLQYLDQFLNKDDPMPDESLPLEHNGELFFWGHSVDNVRMQVNARQEGGSLQGLNRFRVVTITVYDADGDPSSPTRGEPVAALSRLYDPATARNPDTLGKVGVDAIGEILRNIFGDDFQLPAAPPGAGGGGSGGSGESNSGSGSGSRRSGDRSTRDRSGSGRNRSGEGSK